MSCYAINPQLMSQLEQMAVKGAEYGAAYHLQVQQRKEANSFVKPGNCYPFPEEVTKISAENQITSDRSTRVWNFESKWVFVFTSEKVTLFTPEKTIGVYTEDGATDNTLEYYGKEIGKGLPCVFVSRNQYFVKVK